MGIEWKDFNLDDKIVRSLDELGYVKPSKIQEVVIPSVLAGNDIKGKAPTGSGKTAAFLLPLMEKLTTERSDEQVLIVAPTRELAQQIAKDAYILGMYKKLRSVCITGKASFARQKEELSQRVHFIIGTPGRLNEHLAHENIVASQIKYVVIDEVDELLKQGFSDQVEDIVEQLDDCEQRLVFSATYPEEVEELVSSFLKDPKEIEVIEETTLLEQIWISTFIKNVDETLLSLLTNNRFEKGLIFANTKVRVEEITELLKDEGARVNCLHGDLLPQERDERMADFRKGKLRLLVTTNVLARGMDIQGVDVVINAELPWKQEEYIHRIGRTGRMSNSGQSYTIVDPAWHKSQEFYDGLEVKPRWDKEIYPEVKPDLAYYRTVNIQDDIKDEVVDEGITTLYIAAGKKKKLRPGDIVGALSNIEGVTGDDIGRIDIREHMSYVELLNNKGKTVLNALKNTKIKGSIRRVELSNKGFGK